jgi:hypothetical protein
MLITLTLLAACSAPTVPAANMVPESMALHQHGEGLIELRRLFAQGHVRAATQADIDAYLHIAQQVQPSGSQQLGLPVLIPDYTVVLLRPFKATLPMGLMSVRHIIVPAGVGKNDDPNPLFSYYYLETGRCNSPGAGCLGAPKMDAAWHARARRLSGMEPDRDALSESDRTDGNWADTGEKTDKPERPSGLTGQLPID